MELPEFPYIPDEVIRQSKEHGDFAPVFFEWYKYVGRLALLVSNIERNQPNVSQHTTAHDFHILIGLLCRCARLMFSNVVMSHEGRFGESTAIVDRCILESSIKVIWLCESQTVDAFKRYTADGLKAELELKDNILDAVEKRQGRALTIETRMLKSIDQCIERSGLTKEDILAAKKLPNIASMLEQLGFNRLPYIVTQKIGSHHVHGTWVSLWTHYLTETADGVAIPRDSDCETHVNQYIVVSKLVLQAIRSFVQSIFEQTDTATFFFEIITSAESEIDSIFRLDMEDDTKTETQENEFG